MAPTTPPAPAAADRRWAALVVVAVAQLMVALDATIVTIALPSAQRSLGFDDGDRQLVVTAYTLTFAGLLLVGGRVADRLGRRRAFLLGLTGFAASSALAGAAPGLGLLVAGRALQGAFAAVLAPTALSLIAVTFTTPAERARAFGVYGAVASSGGAAGLLLGGGLSQYADWRWCLWVNVAVSAGALLAGWLVLPRTPLTASTQIDLPSAVLATGGLAAVVLGCREAARIGWTAPVAWVPLVLGGAALVGFLARQARLPAPLLPLHILRSPARVGAYVSVAAAVVGSYGVFLLLTYDLQVVRGWSPLRTGLAFLPLTLAVAASAFGLASRLLPHVAARSLIVPGLLVAGAGLMLLTRLTPDSDYVTMILRAEVLLGLGLGCVFTPAISVSTSGVAPREAGVAAAVANTAMQVGGSIGTALLNTVAVTATASHAGGTGPDALVHGYATALAWAAALLVAAALLAARLLRPVAAGDRHPRRRDADRAPAQSREEPTMDDVRAVQERFDRAELTDDRDALRELIADDFRSIGPRGFVMDKEQWIGRHSEFRYERLDTSEVDVRRYGDTAVVRDVQRNRATYQDHPVAVATRVSQVWVRLDGRWELVAIQFSPLADEPATLPEEARR